MSQANIFVQATDGKYYKNPVLQGDGYYICFDDEELPEIVIRKFGNTTEESARKKAISILNSYELKTGSLQLHDKDSSRMFFPSWKAKPAISFFFELYSAIPKPSHAVSGTDSPDPSAVMYTFFAEFEKERLLKAIDETDKLDREIIYLLMKIPHYIKAPKGVKDQLRILIRSQYPNLENEVHTLRVMVK